MAQARAIRQGCVGDCPRVADQEGGAPGRVRCPQGQRVERGDGPTRPGDLQAHLCRGGRALPVSERLVRELGTLSGPRARFRVGQRGGAGGGGGGGGGGGFAGLGSWSMPPARSGRRVGTGGQFGERAPHAAPGWRRGPFPSRWIEARHALASLLLPAPPAVAENARLAPDSSGREARGPAFLNHAYRYLSFVLSFSLAPPAGSCAPCTASPPSPRPRW